MGLISRTMEKVIRSIVRDELSLARTAPEGSPDASPAPAAPAPAAPPPAAPAKARNRKPKA